MESSHTLFSIGLATLAGLSTGIGGVLAIFFKRTNTKLLSVMLGFSAGIMLYISFIELYQESQFNLCKVNGLINGKIQTALSFFFGITLMVLINEFIPGSNRSHQAERKENTGNYRLDTHKKNIKGLLRTGIFTAIAVTVHNFPEGIASYISAMKSTSLGASIALSIAIHNIPEGLAVAVPVYYATGSKAKAFFMSLFSGLSEPLGAIIAMVILGPLITDTVFGIIFGAVAGIMVYISIDELLPAAREYGGHNLSMLGLMLGMAVMALGVIFIF